MADPDTIEGLRAAIARIESGEGETPAPGAHPSDMAEAAPKEPYSSMWARGPAAERPARPQSAGRGRAGRGSRTTAARRNEEALAERGIVIADTGRRARTVRLVSVSCDACAYERIVPRQVAEAASWPACPDAASLDEALARAERRATMVRVQTLVSQRDYAAEEMRARLAQEGFEETAIDEAIERARGYSWLDDERFARQLVSNKLACGWGSVRISRELRHRGVADEIAEDALRQASGGDADEVARAIAVLERGRTAVPPRARDKLYRKLASRGFPASVCSAAVSRYLDAHPEITPW